MTGWWPGTVLPAKPIGRSQVRDLEGVLAVSPRGNTALLLLGGRTVAWNVPEGKESCSASPNLLPRSPVRPSLPTGSATRWEARTAASTWVASDARCLAVSATARQGPLPGRPSSASLAGHPHVLKPHRPLAGIVGRKPDLTPKDRQGRDGSPPPRLPSPTTTTRAASSCSSNGLESSGPGPRFHAGQEFRPAPHVPAIHAQLLPAHCRPGSRGATRPSRPPPPRTCNRAAPSLPGDVPGGSRTRGCTARPDAPAPGDGRVPVPSSHIPCRPGAGRDTEQWAA